MIFRQVMANLKSSPLRSILTLLGIVIGVGLIVLLTSLLETADQSMTMASQDASGDNHLEVSNLSRRKRAKLPSARLLQQDDLKLLKSSEYFSKQSDILFMQELQASEKVKYQKISTEAPVRGLPPQGLAIYKIGIEQGRFYSDFERQKALKVCIIGQKLFKTLLDSDKSKIGNTSIQFNHHTYLLIGILKPRAGMGDTTYQWDNTVVIPDTTYKVEYDNGSKEIKSLYIFTKPMKDLKQQLDIQRNIMTALLLNPRNGIKNFDIDSPLDESKDEAIAKIMLVLLIGMAVIALFVGGINVMNIQLVSVNERIREIGILMAIGATSKNIFKQFLLESLVITGIGGLLGLISGLSLGFIASLIIQYYVPSWTFTVDWKWPVLAIMLALLTGVLSGLYPAYKASKMQPVECLRSE